MTISELIIALQILQNKHGDMRIYCQDLGDGYRFDPEPKKEIDRFGREYYVL